MKTIFNSAYKFSILLTLKILILILFLYGTNAGVASRIALIGWQPTGLAVFASIWFLALATLALVAFSNHRRTRHIWATALLVCSFIGLCFRLITAKDLGFSEFETLIGLLGFADNAIGFYGGMFATAAIWCLLGALAFHIPPFFPSTHPSKSKVARVARHAGKAQVLPVLIICSILYSRGGQGTDGLPVQYNVLAFFTMAGAVSLFDPAPQRKPVELVPVPQNGVKNIVLVMDESIRGDFLDINAGQVKTNIDLAAGSIFNFGISSSIANCSDTTNYAVRYGVTKKNYMRDLLEKPSVWEFAKKAGYRTVYLDAQRHKGRLQNHMSDDERANIDEFYQLSADLKPFQHDTGIATKLRWELENIDRPQFILVNKMGSHFPFEGKYPAEQGKYQPTLTSTYSGNEADPKGVTWPSSEDRATRIRFVNSYLNSTEWNIAEFFKIVLPNLDLSNTIIAYTADHGQDFHENGRPGFSTHCTDGRVVSKEGIVPMAVITRHHKYLDLLAAAVKENLDRTSQFNLIPTLLVFMGYDKNQLTLQNGFEPTLFDKLPTDNRRFLSTFFTRWGREPIWNKVCEVSGQTNPPIC